MEDQGDIVNAWGDFAKLFRELGNLRDQRHKIEKRLNDTKNVDLNSFVPLIDIEKKEQETLASKLQDTDRKIHTVIRRLAEGEWPSHSWIEPDQKTIAQAGVLHILIDKLSRCLPELEQARQEWELMTADATKPNEEDTLDVDNGPTRLSIGSRKRQRLSYGHDDTSSAPASLVPPEEEVVMALKADLHKIEERVSTTENAQNAMITNFQSLLPEALQDHATSITKLDAVQLQVNYIDSQRKQLSSWVGELEQDLRGLNEKNQESKNIQEGQKDDEDVNALIARTHQLELERDEAQEEVAVLTAAINAYTKVPPSPPASPEPFDPQMILVDLKEEVEQCIRDVVESTTHLYRADMERALQERDSEIYKTVWDKIEMANVVITAVLEAMKEPPATLSRLN